MQLLGDHFQRTIQAQAHVSHELYNMVKRQCALVAATTTTTTTTTAAAGDGDGDGGGDDDDDDRFCKRAVHHSIALMFMSTLVIKCHLHYAYIYIKH